MNTLSRAWLLQFLLQTGEVHKTKRLRVEIFAQSMFVEIDCIMLKGYGGGKQIIIILVYYFLILVYLSSDLVNS